jgi:hypothetical protein
MMVRCYLSALVWMHPDFTVGVLAICFPQYDDVAAYVDAYSEFVVRCRALTSTSDSDHLLIALADHYGLLRLPRGWSRFFTREVLSFSPAALTAVTHRVSR